MGWVMTRRGKLWVETGLINPVRRRISAICRLKLILAGVFVQGGMSRERAAQAKKEAIEYALQKSKEMKRP